MQLDIAAYGWQDAHWASLYPEDMPTEWRLDFYSNEFMAIVLPAALLDQHDDTTLTAWFADAPERFHFYWELSDNIQAQRLLHFVQQQGRPAGLAGYLWRGDRPAGDVLSALDSILPGDSSTQAVTVLELDGPPDLKAIRQHILRWQQEGREQCLLVIHPHAGALQTLRQLQTLGILLNG